jgi:hypothetical protein
VPSRGNLSLENRRIRLTHVKSRADRRVIKVVAALCDGMRIRAWTSQLAPGNVRASARRASRKMGRVRRQPPHPSDRPKRARRSALHAWDVAVALAAALFDRSVFGLRHSSKAQ